MKIKHVLYVFLIAIFATGCTSKKLNEDSLPFIDVRKNYPEKEISLTDFADVDYIHLSTVHDDFLYRGSIFNVTNNTIVVYDYSSFSILFFTRDGTPKSRFNRCGQGPEDYFGVSRIIYDEEQDDVFVGYEKGGDKYLKVYSSTGEYKRVIPLPQYTELNWLYTFDNQSLFGHTFNPSSQPERSSYYTTYYRISKTNGEILDSLNLPSNEVRLVAPLQNHIGGTMRVIYSRLVKGTDGFYLCNPETDTVFLYNNEKTLIPVFRKIPSVRNLDPMIVIDNMVDASRYQFFNLSTLYGDRQGPNQKYPNRYYIRDKETGEIFRQKIILPDYKGKEFNINATVRRSYYGDGNGYLFELELMELKKAYDENRLGGKLKELVATLNELEDNNVFMLVHFR